MVLWQSKACRRKGGQNGSWGQTAEGLECPAKEFGPLSIVFEGYPIQDCWDGKSFALASDFSDGGDSKKGVERL